MVIASSIAAFGIVAALAVPPQTPLVADALEGLTVHHVQVSVAHADALAAWYVAKLGFRVTKRATAAGLTIVWLDIPGFRLGFAQIAGSRRDPSQSVPPPSDTMQQGYRQLHFSVSYVDAAYRQLMAAGVHFVVPPTSFAITHVRLATMLDPEGNEISLYQDLDPANALMPPRNARAPESRP